MRNPLRKLGRRIRQAAGPNSGRSIRQAARALTRRLGRPPADLDPVRVADMAVKGYSDRMIADILGVDHRTIARHFSPLLAKKRAEMRGTLSEKQLEVAASGNPALLIFLGKNYLEQSDRTMVAVSQEICVRHASDPEAPDSAYSVSVGDGADISGIFGKNTEPIDSI